SQNISALALSLNRYHKSAAPPFYSDNQSDISFLIIPGKDIYFPAVIKNYAIEIPIYSDIYETTADIARRTSEIVLISAAEIFFSGLEVSPYYELFSQITVLRE
ncbi:MAG: hypothetical protein ACI353_06350, partial [Alloprevotella sp.]